MSMSKILINIFLFKNRLYFTKQAHALAIFIRFFLFIRLSYGKGFSDTQIKFQNKQYFDEIRATENNKGKAFKELYIQNEYTST